MGIDVWIARQRAEKLVAKREASYPLTGLGTLHSQNQLAQQDSSTVESQSRWTKFAELVKEPVLNHRDIPNNDLSTTAQAEPTEEEERGHDIPPYSVSLAVHTYGSATLVSDAGARTNETYFDDLLFALNGFEESRLNELRFNYPHHNSTSATLTGAQQGFKAWIQSRVMVNDQGTLLLVGESSKDVSKLVDKPDWIRLELDEFPQTGESKRALWARICR